MKTTTLIKFQSKNCLNKINFLIFLGVVVFLIINLLNNIADYKNFKDEKKAFLTLEKQKVENYQNYEQYGAYGFSVLNEPSPLTIYFKNSNYFLLESNIDTKEVIKYTSSYAGRVLSQNRIFDPFQFLFYVGSILMIMAGVLSLPPGFRKFMGDRKKEEITIVSKMIFCDLLTASILLVSYGIPYLFGISFSPLESLIYLQYTLYILIIFAFLFVVGTIIAILNKGRVRLLYAIGICLLMIFAIPELVNTKKIKSNINEIHLKKIINTMDFEKDASERLKQKPTNLTTKEFQKNLAIDFTNTVYQKNKKIEDAITQNYCDYIRYQENSLFLIPGGYLEVIHNELSSKGIYSFKEYRQYISKLRKSFIDYYISKRFEKTEKKKIENFIKSTENIFKASSVIPKNFYLSMIANLCYLIIALLIMHRLLGSISQELGENTPCLDVSTLNPGQSYFYLYTEKKDVQKIIACFKKPIIISDYSKESLVEPGTSVCNWMDYMAHLYGLDIDSIRGKVKNILNEQTSEESIEYLRLFLLLIKLEGEKKDVLILDNFLKGLDSAAAQNVQAFLNELKQTILYVSTDLFIAGKMDKSITKNKIIPIDLNNVYLR